jgi:3-methylcrotonyl-CoA carboxylase alpha subunit
VKLRVVSSSGPGEDVEAVPATGAERGVVAVRDGNVVWVFASGETYRVERAPAGRRRSEAEHDLRAPMPGKVLRLLVKDGDAVAKGEPLLVVEAMKMEHEIRAPLAGRVKLLAGEGQMVGLGDVLAEVEEADATEAGR